MHGCTSRCPEGAASPQEPQVTLVAQERPAPVILPFQIYTTFSVHESDLAQIGQCEYIHHRLVAFRKKRLNWVHKYLKRSAFWAWTERHLHGPSGFAPSCNLQTRTASPQSPHVPQSYPVTNGRGCKKIISLSLLSCKRWALLCKGGNQGGN